MSRRCAVCGAAFPPAGRRRYCTDACRQAAWRRRSAASPGVPALPAPRPRREGTACQCPDCDTRYLSEQWCPGCTRPAGGSDPAAPAPAASC